MKSNFPGELLVIVEYCHYGNLRTFIIDHRETFVNQVDENGELIASDVENDADDVVTTRKLICWSFQIARGMDYLVSKKVIPSLIVFLCAAYNLKYGQRSCTVTWRPAIFCWQITMSSKWPISDCPVNFTKTKTT